jgi:hypothetical protein
MSITLESIVPVQADRDELLQLLNLLNTHWHQNEEAFANRSLAAWPQWCEDQGFRFELLKDLARNLESTLTYPEGCPGLDPLITALGPAATTAQLLNSLDQELPQFLEGFDQILQISHEETAALGAQAGGSAKGYIAGHPKVDLAVGVVATTALASGGLGIYAYVLRRRQQVVAELDESVRRDVSRAESTIEETLSSDIESIRSSGSFNKEEDIAKGLYQHETLRYEKIFEAGGELLVRKMISSKGTDYAFSVAESEMNTINDDISERLKSASVRGEAFLDRTFTSELDHTVERMAKSEEYSISEHLDNSLDNLEAKAELDLESKLKESATDFAENEFEIISEQTEIANHGLEEGL